MQKFDFTFVQGRIRTVEVHQAADVSLVAEIGRRRVLPWLRGGICEEGNPNKVDLTERICSLVLSQFIHAQ